MLAAAVLSAACIGPEPLPAEKISPPDFLEQRRLQDELRDAGQGERAQIRAREMLAEARTPAHLTLAARVEDDLDQVLALLEEALERDPQFAWARYGMAFVVLQSRVFDRYEESAGHLRWLLERGFDSSANPELKTRRLLIENLNRLGQSEEEAEQVAALLETNPSDLESRYRLAWILCIKLDEPGEAVSQLDFILSRDPDDIDARMLKARALWNEEDYRAAEALYQELAGLHPNAFLNLAFLYEQKLSQPERALEYYRRFLEYDGYNADRRGWYDLNFLVPNKIESLSKVLP